MGERTSAAPPRRHRYWTGFDALKAATASSSVAKMRSSPILAVSAEPLELRADGVADVGDREDDAALPRSCSASSTRVFPPV